MKKDGVLEAMKASRLSIINDTTDAKAVKRKAEPAKDEELSSKRKTRAMVTRSGGNESESSVQTDSSHTKKRAVSPQAAPRAIFEVRAKDGSRGVPKSGRTWKRVKNQRFSSIRNDKPDSSSWQNKQMIKSDAAAVKSLGQQLKEEKLERERLERERIADRQKKKEENEKKNEIVVPIKNVAKLKRMRKKQLRTIQKR